MLELFGADRILWVEGQTEEICFPLLLGAEEGQGCVTVKAVPATGHFSAKKRTKKMVLDLYQSVTESVAPLIEKMVFSFDREDLSPQAASAFENEHKGRLFLLPRRNLESYLLVPSAVAEVINFYMLDRQISTEDVQAELDLCGGSESFGASKHWKGNATDPVWLTHVDGAKLLKQLFGRLTNNQLEFRKTKHTPEILLSVKASSPNSIEELVRFVKGLFRAVLA